MQYGKFDAFTDNREWLFAMQGVGCNAVQCAWTPQRNSVLLCVTSVDERVPGKLAAREFRPFEIESCVEWEGMNPLIYKAKGLDSHLAFSFKPAGWLHI